MQAAALRDLREEDRKALRRKADPRALLRGLDGLTVENFASQDFDICLRCVCWKFCGELRRFAETYICPSEMTSKYCGDLRRRRVRRKNCAEN